MGSLYVLQGVPGSGKSFLAQIIADGLNAEYNEYQKEYFVPGNTSGPEPNAVICSTDDFFAETGKYIFDPKKLGENHQKCYNKAVQALNNGQVAIIDNTNVHAWECRDYVRHAVFLEFPVVFIRVTGEFQSIHGVPTEKIQQMKSEMEDLTVEKCLAAKKPWEK